MAISYSGLTQEEQNSIPDLPPMVATEYIDNDEAALSLMEVDYKSLDGRGWHRYELINVIRNDSKARYMRDMGPREAFPTYGTTIISGGTDRKGHMVRYWSAETVGYLRDSANDLRKRNMLEEAGIAVSESFQDNYLDTIQRKRDRKNAPTKSAQFGYGKLVNTHG